MAKKKANPKSKMSVALFRLLDEFDLAAKDTGYKDHEGQLREANSAEARYTIAKEKLSQAIIRLERLGKSRQKQITQLRDEISQF